MQGVRIDEVDAASETSADIEIEDQAQVQAKALDSSDVVDTDYDEGLNTNSYDDHHRHTTELFRSSLTGFRSHLVLASVFSFSSEIRI